MRRYKSNDDVIFQIPPASDYVGVFVIYSQATNDAKTAHRIVGKGHNFNRRITTNL